MRKLPLFLLTSFLSISAFTAAKAETLTIVSDDWCPYNCVATAKDQGILIEIARKAFEPMGLTVEYKNVPWTRAVEGTREGKFTAITGASHGDAPDFIFPETPQSSSLMTFFVKEGNTWKYENLDSLAKVSLGSIDSYSYGDDVDAYIEKNKTNPKLVQLVSGDAALDINTQKLLKGRINATVESENVMGYFLAQHNLTGKIVPAGSIPLTDEQNVYMAFSPKNPNSEKYAKALSDTTKKLIETGEMTKILAKYGITAPKAEAKKK